MGLYGLSIQSQSPGPTALSVLLQSFSSLAYFFPEETIRHLEGACVAVFFQARTEMGRRNGKEMLCTVLPLELWTSPSRLGSPCVGWRRALHRVWKALTFSSARVNNRCPSFRDSVPNDQFVCSIPISDSLGRSSEICYS